MLHADRVWCVAEVDTPEELARQLTEVTWCLCQGFRVQGHPHYVWLNDSTSPDGAQEFAVVKLGLADDHMTQLESITFGWCDYDRALELVRATLNGGDDTNEWARPVDATLQTPEEHGTCIHCA